MAVGADPALAGNWLVYHAQHGLAPEAEADQRAPGHRARGKVARAVDRVQNPDPVSIEPRAAELLAQNPVVGVSGLDEGAHRSLPIEVRLGHYIRVLRRPCGRPPTTH